MLKTMTVRAAIAAILAGVSMSAHALADTQRIDIPAGSLLTALETLAKQADVDLVYQDSQVEGVRTGGVTGELSPQDAVVKLLQGTPLEVRRDETSGAILITTRVTAPAAAPSPTGSRTKGQESASAEKPSWPRLRLAQNETLQQAAPTQAAAQRETRPQEPEQVIVVGSRIEGAAVTDMLPVVVLTAEEMDAVAASSGDDLLRSIPQAGDVAFNESRDAGGINDARGDTASINLRALGTGNTLVLLNGRRMVLHPGTQSENLVPVQSVNTNAIPTMGVQRLEVLLDGAAAIYGTDAVAGVVNTVLKNDLEGFAVESEVRVTDGSDQEQYEVAFEAGERFNDGRTNVSLFGSFNHRDPLYARERRNSRSSDLRPLVQGTPFEGDTDFDNRSNDTPWGEFRRLSSSYQPVTTVARVDGVALTTSGTFHVQPDTNEGCIAQAGPGVCFDNSTLSTASTDNNLRYQTNDERTIMGENDRINLFGFVNHEISDTLELFGEIGFYRADYEGVREQDTTLASQRVIVPANAYYNPFGPVGSPNRLAGLTGVADSGVPLELLDYRPIDAGPLRINVENTTTRYLGGARGELAGWDWESAVLYSRARTDDTMRTLSLTLFQEALGRTDASAYNPFDGSNPLDPGRADSTPNPQEVIDGFTVDVSRVSTTELALADVRISRNDLFALPAGNIGLAAGAEVRYESFEDDRDDRLDGTVAFVALDGSSNGSDVIGVSPTPDTRGSRDVASAYLELAIPVVSPEMGVPLVHSIDVQLAERYEHYEGFGSVAKPKVALSYRPVEWLQLRSAWSQGFRAPNLPQLFEQGIQRANGRTDQIRCEADLRAGRIANFDACTRSQTVVSNRSGSRELDPEEAENFTVGFTLEGGLPNDWGHVTFTADYWQIEQEGVIGLFGDTNALTLDYLLRVQGSSNPNVERAAPTAEDIADFEGTGLEPVGRVIQVVDNYTNLTPREVQGLDLGLYYRLRDTPLGTFNVRLNAARLYKFFQEPGAQQQMLLDAQLAGVIVPTINVVGAEDLIEQNGRPKWRGTAMVSWRLGQVGAGYYAAYVGKVTDTSASLADGTRFEVDDYLTHNLYVQYTIDSDGLMDGTRLRLGVRNLANDLPPLADQSFGYIGDLYSNMGRAFYASLRKRF